VKARSNVRRAGAVAIVLWAAAGCSRDEPQPDRGEAERVVREFVLALGEGDEARLRQRILPHPDAQMLWSKDWKAGQLADWKAAVEQMSCRQARPGESFALPDGSEFTLKADDVRADRQVIVCTTPAEKFPLLVWVARQHEQWKVDVGRMIAGAIKAAVNQAKADVRMLSDALQLFWQDTMKYPTTEQGLKALVEAPANERIRPYWKGPYVRAIPKDPWGTPYGYICPGVHNPQAYDLFSCGPDKQEGGVDDISNW